MFKSFNPIFKLSRKGFEALKAEYDQGGYGFYEAVLPTIMMHNGLLVKQFDELIGDN